MNLLWPGRQIPLRWTNGKYHHFVHTGLTVDTRSGFETSGVSRQNKASKYIHLKGAPMFNIQIKCAMNNREVPLERFVTLFLEETARRAIEGATSKLARVEEHSSQNPHLPHSTQSGARVLSVDETARTLGLKPATIRAWVAARKMGSVRLGRRVMVPLEAIDDLLARGFIPARKQE